MSDLLEQGTSAILALALLKLLEFFVSMYKAKKEKSSQAQPEIDPAFIQSQNNSEELNVVKGELRGIKDIMKRVEKVLINGNGSPGLVTQVALLNQSLSAHLADDHLHKK